MCNHWWLSSMLFGKNISENQKTLQKPSCALLLLTVQLRVSSLQWSLTLLHLSKRTSGLRRPESSDWESGPTLPIIKTEIQKNKYRWKCKSCTIDDTIVMIMYNLIYTLNSDSGFYRTDCLASSGQNIYCQVGLCWCKRCRGMGRS